jgi:hypothetical protein
LSSFLFSFSSTATTAATTTAAATAAATTDATTYWCAERLACFRVESVSKRCESRHLVAPLLLRTTVYTTWYAQLSAATTAATTAAATTAAATTAATTYWCAERLACFRVESVSKRTVPWYAQLVPSS